MGARDPVTCQDVVCAVGARSRGKAPVVAPGPGPGTVGIAPAGPREGAGGAFGRTGMGTSRGPVAVPMAAPAAGGATAAPGEGVVAAAVDDPPSPAVAGEEAAPEGDAAGAPDTAEPPSGVFPAGGTWGFWASVIGRSDGAGESAGGAVGWSAGCWSGAAKVPLCGTICGDDGTTVPGCRVGAAMFDCPGMTCCGMSAPAAPQIGRAHV